MEGEQHSFSFAADLITSMSLAIAGGLGKRELKRWIIPHPTLSEVLTVS